MVEERAGQKDESRRDERKGKGRKWGVPLSRLEGFQGRSEKPLNIYFGLQAACFIRMKNVDPLARHGGITVIYLLMKPFGSEALDLAKWE